MTRDINDGASSTDSAFGDALALRGATAGTSALVLTALEAALAGAGVFGARALGAGVSDIEAFGAEALEASDLRDLPLPRSLISNLPFNGQRHRSRVQFTAK
jgi:hypothetical protein